LVIFRTLATIFIFCAFCSIAEEREQFSDADALRRSGKSDQGISVYRKILGDGKAPVAQKSAAWVGLVRALHDKGDFTACASEALKFDAENPAVTLESRALVRLLLMHSLWDMQQDDKALEAFASIVPQWPSLLPVSLYEPHRGVVPVIPAAFRTRAVSRFIQLRTKLTTLSERCLWLAVVIADQFKRMGEFESAEEILLKAAAEKNDASKDGLAAVKQELGELYFDTHQRDKAEVLFQETAELDGASDDSRARASYWAAVVTYSKSEFKRALQLFKETLDRFPKASDDEKAACVLQIGWCHVQLKNESDANEAFLKFKNAYPATDETLLMSEAFGEAMLALGESNPGAAIEICKQAWKAHPSASPAILALSRLMIAFQIYAKDGRMAEAETLVKEALDLYDTILSTEDLGPIDGLHYSFAKLDVFRNAYKIAEARPLLLSILDSLSGHAKFWRERCMQELVVGYWREFSVAATGAAAEEELIKKAKEAFGQKVWTPTFSMRLADALLNVLFELNPTIAPEELMSKFQEILAKTGNEHVAGYAFSGVAKLLNRKNKPQEAEVFFKRILSSNNSPFRPDALFMSAAFFSKQLRDDEAIPLLDELLQKYPQSPVVPQALYLLGWISFTRNDFAKASKLLNTLIKDHADCEQAEKARKIITQIELTLSGAQP